MDSKEHNASPSAKETSKIFSNPWVRGGIIVALALVVAGGALYFVRSGSRVSVDKSLVSAPGIDLSSASGGTLDEVYVHEGDQVAANQVVAKVGGDLVKTKVPGTVISVSDNIGKMFTPGQAVVSMIDPSQLRVVGTVDENKGFSRIAIGQPVSFTVDAYGGKKYVGVVDEVASTSHQTGVVFNISDQRATQQFDIKVRFNTADYPELKNGMSAKITVYTN